MPEEIKINRTSQMASQPRAEHAQPAAQEPKDKMSSGPSKTPWLILGIIVVVLVLCGIVFRGKLFGKPGAMGGDTGSGKPSGYQAVFLTNGQVYFGKLSAQTGDYVTLDDIYYLQVGPQQGSTAQPAPTAQQAQQQITLVKLGNELHGPVDEMHISRAQVLFYEDLKEDGQVVKAIIQDKNAKK